LVHQGEAVHQLQLLAQLIFGRNARIDAERGASAGHEQVRAQAGRDL